MLPIRGVLAVVAGVLIHLTLGSFYTYGNVSTYMTSYIKARVDPSMDYSKAIWVNAALFFGQGVAMPFGGILENRIGPRWTCLVGCVVFSGSVMLTTLSVKKSYALVVLTYGFLASNGIGISYVAALIAAVKWFPRRKGIISGIIVAGFGLGALIINQIQTWYLNPQNLQVDESGYFTENGILDRVPTVFLLLGGVYGAVQLLGIAAMFTPPEQQSSDTLQRRAELPEKSDVPQYSSQDRLLPEDNMPPMKVLKTKEFYMLFFTFALSGQCVQFINSMYKAFGQTFITDDHFLVAIGSVGSVFNCSGRILWGLLFDRTSYKFCMFLLCGLQAFWLFTFHLSIYGGKYLFSIWVLAIFFTLSGMFSLFPAVTTQTFGAKYGGTNYGMVFLGPSITSLITAFLIQVVLTAFGWFGSFCLVGFLSLAAMAITVFFPENNQRIRNTGSGEAEQQTRPVPEPAAFTSQDSSSRNASDQHI